MARDERRNEPSVAAQLFREAYRFGFYQAVRLLEILRPGSQPLGEGADPSREPVRLRAAISLAFPPADLHELQEGQTSAPPELTVNFLSLAGLHGPLPHPVTERILERTFRKDTALRDFLDLFHHRLLSLVYRVHRAHRLGMETGAPERHTFASYLYALLGLGTPGLRGRMAVPDRSLLRYTGLLHKSPRDAAGLVTLLSDTFGVAVRCEPLVGAFRALDPGQCTTLGEEGQNRSLGVDTMLGGSVWDQQAGIHLVIGPLTFAQYKDFLPGGRRCVALCQLARFYLGPQLDLRVTALLAGPERPPLVLSSKQGSAALGWNTWLVGRGHRGAAVVEVALFELQQFCDAPPAPPAPPAAEAGKRGA